jgi:hypothetical protein
VMAFTLPDERELRGLWRARPSTIDGYQRCYYSETQHGDRIEIDFNYARQMARILVALESDRGREYISVIKSGTIIQERELASKRSLDLTSRMAVFAKAFAALPDANVLRVIGGNYGLPILPHLPDLRGDQWRELRPLTHVWRPLQYVRRRLKARREREAGRSFWQSLVHRLPAELGDLALGGALVWAYLNQWLNLTELAGYAGALGVFSGALDWVWRQRDPFLPKVLALMGVSAFAVYTQVQYRMWAIFL